MGNNPSSSRQSTSSPQGPPHATAPISNQAVNNVRREPRRRESIQALSNVKATAAPPSASLESATAHSTAARPLRPNSRGRAHSVATPTLKPHDISQLERMGSGQSHEKDHREPSPPPAEPSPLTQPVDVPQPRATSSSPPGAEPSSQSDTYHMQSANFARPPRLPLPIEEEVHTPGSPIISPADLTTPIDPESIDGVLPRRTSVLSSTTADEDDAADDSFDTEGGLRPAVPTIIEWLGPGEKVYVTGTFAGWNKKFRLHKSGPSKHKDAFSATIHLQPGTHHLKFLVDNEMQLSPELPTAVDFTNILVNYLEVSPDDIPQEQQPQPTAPVDIPGQPRQEDEKPEMRVPPGVYPPQILPPSPEIQQISQNNPSASGTPAPATSNPVVVAAAPPKQYHCVIPQYLADLDAEEESSRFARASAALNTTPPPPSLPVMLSKSILNGSTPMKDDSSVLNMPNHTVLNHLATSSIKHNVLATSATTRYKRKFLTTIMYKPTSDTGE